MKPLNNPHDAIFKQSMQRPFVAKQFMQYYLPAKLVSQLDLESLTMLDATYIDNQLESAFSDVVFSCQLAGHDATVSLLVEHQSKPDKFMPVRVGYYMFSLFMRHLKDAKRGLIPAAYCLVFYHGKKYPYSMSLADCFDDPLGLMQNLFSKPVPLVDVSQLSDDQLRQQQLIGSLAQTLKHIRDADITDLVQELYLRYRSETESNEALLSFIVNLLQYALSVGNADQNKLSSVIEHVEPESSQLGESVMRIADILRQEGMEQGVQKGLEQGAQQNKIETAQRLLARGFSVADAADIAGLTEEQVAELAKAH